MTGVYRITNTKTNDFYIGSSKNIERRWKSHKCKSNMERQPNNKMYQDMIAYGTDIFKFEVLEECSIEKLREQEQYWIDKLKPSYNRCPAYISPEDRLDYNRTRNLEYDKLHREKATERVKRWKEKNKDKVREAQKRHREKQKLLTGNN